MIYISHLFPDEDIKDMIQEAHVGVESIEFSISENLDHLGEKIHTYGDRLKMMGDPELILHGPFLDLNPAAYDSKIQQVTHLRFAQAYEAAMELGAKKIVYHSCYYPQVYFLDGWAERAADFMNRFLEDRTEVEVDMENVLDPQWQPLRRVAELVEAPNFGLCLDVGHAHCYSKIPVCEWAQGLLPYIRHLHLHDNGGDRDAHLAVGDGTVPFADIFRIFRINGKNREKLTWTIECQRKADAQVSVEKLRTFIQNSL